MILKFSAHVPHQRPEAERVVGGSVSSPAELGVEGELAWLPWADTLVALTAVLAAYMLASSWNLPMFFLYRILLLPNQFETCGDADESSGYGESRRTFAAEAPRR